MFQSKNIIDFHLTTLDLAVIKFWYKFCVRRISLFKVDIFFW